MAMTTSATLISEATSGSKGAMAGSGWEAVGGRGMEGKDGTWGRSPEAPVGAPPDVPDIFLLSLVLLSSRRMRLAPTERHP